MTRINVVDVEELTDNFLLAEVFELPRLYPLIAKAAMRGDTRTIPTYRTGEGHMRFFYNKLTFLEVRQNALHIEGQKRGLKLVSDPNAVMTAEEALVLLTLPQRWREDYTPTAEAIQVNRDRLQYRRRYDGGSYSTT